MNSKQPGKYRYAEGSKQLYWIWWVIGPLIKIVLLLPFLWKQIHTRALLITSGFFILTMFCLENVAIYFGWWIWNENKLLGPKVFLVPLEEFLLYWVGAPSVLVIYHVFLKLFQTVFRKRA